LPVLTNQKLNAYLKEIATIIGINKNLSTLAARHTFATTVTLANQVSIEVVSKMLGHSSISIINKYARVVDDLLSRDMQKLVGMLDKPITNFKKGCSNRASLTFLKHTLIHKFT